MHAGGDPTRVGPRRAVGPVALTPGSSSAARTASNRPARPSRSPIIVTPPGRARRPGRAGRPRKPGLPSCQAQMRHRSTAGAYLGTHRHEEWRRRPTGFDESAEPDGPGTGRRCGSPCADGGRAGLESTAPGCRRPPGPSAARGPRGARAPGPPTELTRPALGSAPTQSIRTTSGPGRPARSRQAPTMPVASQIAVFGGDVRAPPRPDQQNDRQGRPAPAAGVGEVRRPEITAHRAVGQVRLWRGTPMSAGRPPVRDRGLEADDRGSIRFRHARRLGHTCACTDARTAAHTLRDRPTGPTLGPPQPATRTQRATGPWWEVPSARRSGQAASPRDGGEAPRGSVADRVTRRSRHRRRRLPTTLTH